MIKVTRVFARKSFIYTCNQKIKQGVYKLTDGSLIGVTLLLPLSYGWWMEYTNIQLAVSGTCVSDTDFSAMYGASGRR